MQLETIAAISTPTAPAGVGVIRVSGKDAVEIADKIFRPVGDTPLTEKKGYTAAFGHVFDGDGDIDECVALVFRAPHSFTGEDTVELSCHGGVYLLRRVLRALYKAGARPAQAGEFTRRAFVNGKMDLTGAEAVMDLIAADGKLAAKTALATKEGATFRALTKVKEELLGVAAQFAAFVDYPDEDIPALSDAALSETLEKGEQALSSLLSTFDAGRVLREGIDTVIVGAPNVGKSTLMNALSGCERSIVTPIAGTTRDIVEETVKLGEVTLRLSDTAGIRETGDVVESIGVEKALTRAKSASLILAVFDGSRPFTDGDRRLVETIKQETVIAVVNKGDLPCRLDETELTDHFPYVVHLSAQSGDGIAALTKAVEQVTGVCRLQGDTPVLATERQRLEAENALLAIREGLAALQCGITHDAVNVCVDDALSAILSLTGEKATEAVVDEVFSRFCVGK